MLNQLLELLRAGGTHRVTDLARALDTTSELVQAMLDDLSRMGYLSPVGGDCAGACAACPLPGLCTAAGSGRAWALTDKA